MIARPIPDDGRPAWQQVEDMFRKYGAPPPPTQLRDEIVCLWLRAHYEDDGLVPVTEALRVDEEAAP